MKTRLLLVACICLGIASWAQTNAIRLNQVGFYTYGPKIAAIIGSSATTFSIKSVDRDITYHNGTLSAAVTWAASGESVKTADFSSFVRPGTYVVDVEGLGYSYSFSIGPDVLVEVNRMLSKSFYFNRCSVALPAEYAGKWARNAGHPDNEVIILPSAASASRPAGTKISSPKGWYDAGDFNLYLASSGIAVYSLVTAYEHYSSYYDTLSLNIPESGNNLPDILDQVKWNTDWMLTMQDPSDGGVYFKKTDAVFNGFEMPEDDNVMRYMCKKTTSSAFNFAASMAVVYRVFKAFDQAYANQCLNAAKAAYVWGVANQDIVFANPLAEGVYPAITTGDYVDTDLSDEYEWAANELYIATKDEAYYASGYKPNKAHTLPNWNMVRTLGLVSLVHHRQNLTALGLADTTSMKNRIIALANVYSNYQKNTSPYKIVMGQSGNTLFDWGSNGFAARQSFILLNAYRLSNNADYLNAALSNVDYLLGRNAMGYCFVTGVGDKSPMHISHRQSEADEVSEPVPGWMVGGPSNVTYISDGCANKASTPATSYIDQHTCFTKNEVDINWNSVAVYATGATVAYAHYNREIPTSLLAGSISKSVSTMYTYPNPSTEEMQLIVNSVSSEKAQMIFSNSFGAIVVEKWIDLTEGQNNFQLSGFELKKGVYAIQVKSSNGSLCVKHVVE